MWIFRTWITARDGTKIYAKDHGKRPFDSGLVLDQSLPKRTS